MPGAASRLRRVVGLVGIGIVVVALLGATYQGIVTSLERRAFPRPGRLVDIGSHQLHLFCSGTGTPTVVLEAAAGAASVAWADVQARGATRTRVCSYDRSGTGWSEASGRPFGPDEVATELRALLTGAQEQPPYVVVGHGLGAALARLFASQSPRDVVALVVIESSTGRLPLEDDLARLGDAAPWLARFGLLRLSGRLSHHVDEPGSDPERRAMRSFLNRPDHLTRSARTLARAREIEQRAADAGVSDLGVSRVVLGPDGDASRLTGANAEAVAAAIDRVVTTARREAPSQP